MSLYSLIPAKKNLGQHFLLNPSTLDKILRIAHVTATDNILEIGPGPGGLTERLAAKAARVVAIEKDARFVEELRERLAYLKNLEIIEGDILDVNWKSPPPPFEKGGNGGIPWKVVANLPYNIATEVIFYLLDARQAFSSFYLMVQEEVAERFVAGPGSKNYGNLAILTQIYSKNKIVMRLPPGAFTPPPKVRSAVVEFLIHPTLRFPIQDLEFFKKIVRAAFGQRRKMLRNNLKGLVSETQMERAGIKPTARAEELAIDQFVELSNDSSQ